MAKVKLHGNYAEYGGKHWTGLEPAMPDVCMKTKFSYRMVKQCVSLLVTILFAIFAAVWLPCEKAQTLYFFLTQTLCFVLFVIIIVWWIRKWTKKYFEKRANREIVLEDGKIEEGTILKAVWIRKEENGATKNFLKIQCTVPSPSGDLVQDFTNIPVSSDHLSSMARHPPPVRVFRHRMARWCS